MSNLIFKYGAMCAAKTADLIITKYNYDKNNVKNVAIKPSRDTREGVSYITSRLPIKCDAELVNNYFTVDYILNRESSPEVILIDEIQFFDPKIVDVLVELADKHNKLIFCYGLLRTFKEDLFPTSARLVSVGAKLVELKSTCQHEGCKNSADHTLAKYDDGTCVPFDAPNFLIDTGKKINYFSLCRQHWMQAHNK